MQTHVDSWWKCIGNDGAYVEKQCFVTKSLIYKIFLFVAVIIFKEILRRYYFGAAYIVSWCPLTAYT